MFGEAIGMEINEIEMKKVNSQKLYLLEEFSVLSSESLSKIDTSIISYNVNISNLSEKTTSKLFDLSKSNRKNQINQSAKEFDKFEKLSEFSEKLANQVDLFVNKIEKIDNKSESSISLNQLSICYNESDNNESVKHQRNRRKTYNCTNSRLSQNLVKKDLDFKFLLNENPQINPFDSNNDKEEIKDIIKSQIKILARPRAIATIQTDRKNSLFLRPNLAGANLKFKKRDSLNMKFKEKVVKLEFSDFSLNSESEKIEEESQSEYSDDSIDQNLIPFVNLNKYKEGIVVEDIKHKEYIQNSLSYINCLNVDEENINFYGENEVDDDNNNISENNEDKDILIDQKFSAKIQENLQNKKIAKSEKDFDDGEQNFFIPKKNCGLKNFEISENEEDIEKNNNSMTTGNFNTSKPEDKDLMILINNNEFLQTVESFNSFGFLSKLPTEKITLLKNSVKIYRMKNQDESDDQKKNCNKWLKREITFESIKTKEDLEGIFSTFIAQNINNNPENENIFGDQLGVVVKKKNKDVSGDILLDFDAMILFKRKRFLIKSLIEASLDYCKCRSFLNSSFENGINLLESLLIKKKGEMALAGFSLLMDIFLKNKRLEIYEKNKSFAHHQKNLRNLFLKTKQKVFLMLLFNCKKFVLKDSKCIQTSKKLFEKFKSVEDSSINLNEKIKQLKNLKDINKFETKNIILNRDFKNNTLDVLKQISDILKNLTQEINNSKIIKVKKQRKVSFELNTDKKKLQNLTSKLKKKDIINTDKTTVKKFVKKVNPVIVFIYYIYGFILKKNKKSKVEWFNIFKKQFFYNFKYLKSKSSIKERPNTQKFFTVFDNLLLKTSKKIKLCLKKLVLLNE